MVVPRVIMHSVPCVPVESHPSIHQQESPKEGERWPQQQR